jgi:hypothetical protein
MFISQNAKGQLLEHGDYSSIVTCSTNGPRYFEGHLELFAVFKNAICIYVTVPLETLTVFYGTLVGKRGAGRNQWPHGIAEFK